MRRLALLCPLVSLLACASPKSAPMNDAPSPSEVDAAAPESEPAAANAAAAGGARMDGEQAPEATKRATGEEADHETSIMKGAPAPAPPGSARPSEDDDADADESDALNLRVSMISGGLDRDIIRRVARDGVSDLQSCVPKALAQNPALSELLTLELSIDSKGNVSEVEVAEGSTFTLSEVERCVLELAKSWSFPPADNGEATTLTLELSLAS